MLPTSHTCFYFRLDSFRITYVNCFKLTVKIANFFKVMFRSSTELGNGQLSENQLNIMQESVKV